MKFLVLLSAVVLVAQGRPQTATNPQGVPSIAVAFENFNKLWLAEALRNSVAPASHFKTTYNAVQEPSVAQKTTQVETTAVASPDTQPLVKTAEPQPEPQLEVAPEPTHVESKPQPITKVEAVSEKLSVANMPEETPSNIVVEVVTPAPDMNTAFANYHKLWLAEAARNAIAPTNFAKQTVTLSASNVQATQDTSNLNQVVEPVVEENIPVDTPPATLVATPSEVPVEATVKAVESASEAPVVETASVKPVDHQAEFAEFHKLWEQEAARNAIPPALNHQVFQTIITPEVTPQVVASPSLTPVLVPVSAPLSAPVAAPVPVSAPVQHAILPSSAAFGGHKPLIFILPNWALTGTPTV